MSITGLFIVLLISCLFILGISSRTQTAGSASGWSPMTIPVTSNAYSQQFNELDNVNNVLNRPVKPGNKYISELLPNDEDAGAPSTLPKESMPDIKRMVVSEGSRVIIESKQPYFLDNALIVDYYGAPHYWDWRYPQQPIPIAFATEPEKFVKEHPEVYPSYVVLSKNFLG
jgi:hypothetical protein